MQFTTLLLTAVLALTATAHTIPTHTNSRVHHEKNICKPEQEAYCCTELTKLGVFDLVGVNCASVPIAGCSQKAACCNNKTAQVGLVNLNLECNNIL